MFLCNECHSLSTKSFVVYMYLGISMKICIKCIYGFTESVSIASTVSVICKQIIGFEVVNSVSSDHLLKDYQVCEKGYLDLRI